MSLRELWKEAKITQKELARRVGVHIATVGKIEREIVKPSDALVIRINAVLQSNVGVLYKPPDIP